MKKNRVVCRVHATLATSNNNVHVGRNFMDTTKDFLARILPSTGNCVITIITAAGYPRNESFDNLTDMVAAIRKYDQTPDTVYHAILTHNNNIELQSNSKAKVKRTKQTAYMAKTLCFDLDVGPEKAYKTQKQAANALTKVGKVLALPTPTLISSGKGLHVYWPLTTSISADDWTEVSIALRLGLEENNLAIDASKIHDSSMILRPVGTHHKKDPDNWIEVTEKYTGSDTDIKDWRDLLAPWLGKAVVKAAAKLKPNAPTKVSKIAGVTAITAGDFPPIDLDKVAISCNQIKLILLSAGAGVEEPLWRLTLGMAKHTANPTEAIERLCSGHPEYDINTSLNKMDGWTSPPPTCAAFDAQNSANCKGCKYSGMGRAPHTAAGDTVIAAPAFIANEVLPDLHEYVLPDGYEIYNNRITQIVSKMVKVKNDEGKVVEELGTERETVCRYVIVVLDRFTDIAHTETIITVGVLYPVIGWKRFEIPMTMLSAGGPELNRLLGNQQLFISSDEEVKRTRRYLMTYLEELQRRNATSYIYDKFGWQDDDTFLCGDRLLGDKLNRNFKLSGLAKSLSEHMRPAGTLEGWKKATEVYNHPDAHILQHFLNTALGNFALKGSTINSALFNMYSPGTGTGKTMTIHAINSICGNPQKLMLKSSDTDNSMFKIFGTMNNLTSCIDELHTMTPERRKPVIMQLTQGQERKRLGANSDLLVSVSWQAIVIAASNTDLLAEAELSMSTEAEKARIFQATIPKSDRIGTLGLEAAKGFFRNYGHVQPLLAQKIIDLGGPIKVYEAAEAKFEKKYGFKFTSEERHVYAGFVVSSIGGAIAKSLGIIAYEPRDGLEAGLKAMAKIRTQASSSAADAFDIIGQYLVENDKFMVEYVENQTVGRVAKGIARSPLPENVIIRLEIVCTDTIPLVGGRLCINKVLFKRWLQKQGGDYTKLLTDLGDMGAQVKDNERVSLYKGCDKSNPGQAFCLTIQITHPRLLAVMSDNRVANLSISPRLAIVQNAPP